MSELPWLQDALSSEHFIRKSTGQLIDNPTLKKDAEVLLTLRMVHQRAQQHISDIASLMAEVAEEPSAVREMMGSALGAALGWMERLPNRELIQVVRDVYMALNYAAAGYHVLYARSILLDRVPLADLALRNLRDYTPAIRGLSELLAWSAALELPAEKWQGKDRLKEITATLFDSWSSDLPLARSVGSA